MIKKQILFTKLIWMLWILLVVVGCLYYAFSKNDVSGIYYYAGLHWLQGKALYNQLGTGFIYLPQSAIFYLPLSLLPLPVAEYLWRFTLILFFAYSLYKFARLVEPEKANWVFIIVSCFTIPLSMAIAEDGQMHLMIMSLILFASLAIYHKKWWQAAFLLASAVIIKPTAIVAFLLFGVLFSKLWWRIIIASIVMILIPFLTQSPNYVIAQYQAFIHNLLLISRIEGISPKDWAQLFSVIQIFTGFSFSSKIQLIIRLMFAMIVLGLCYKIKRKFPLKQAIIFILTLGTIYLMLFNPRTENNDYVMLMPFIGIAFIDALSRKKPAYSIYLLVTAFLFTINHAISPLITPLYNMWLKPILTFLFAIYIITTYCLCCRGPTRILGSTKSLK